MADQWMVELLQKDVVPALGCTEPVCVALCAAYASREITEEIVSIQVSVNAGIYKNGMSAGIPHCGKVGCALKVSAGSAAAVLCALTAMEGAALRVSDGICAETPEQCIRNMARIGRQGMSYADAVILDVMSKK